MERFCILVADFQLKALLVPFGIPRFDTEGWGAYQRHLAPALQEVRNPPPPQLERTHLPLRTRIKRLVRKTICFSQSMEMHALVLGLFLNRFELGVSI